jgi:hypothetical protein
MSAFPSVAGSMKRILPLLDSLRIASPCSESWDAMVGDERVRFCCRCEKNVYNLSAMSREEAAQVVRDREGELCARMYQRADGTLMTQDCPVGVRRKRVRRVATLAIGAGTAAAAMLASQRATTCHVASVGAITRVNAAVAPPGDNRPIVGELAVAPAPAAMVKLPSRDPKTHIIGAPVAPAVMGSVAAPVRLAPVQQPEMGRLARPSRRGLAPIRARTGRSPLSDRRLGAWPGLKG